MTGVKGAGVEEGAAVRVGSDSGAAAVGMEFAAAGPATAQAETLKKINSTKRFLINPNTFITGLFNKNNCTNFKAGAIPAKIQIPKLRFAARRRNVVLPRSRSHKRQPPPLPE